MLYHLSVHFIEIASVLLFILALRSAWRSGRQRVAELVFAFLYGFLLEELDIYFFRTYHYGPGFLLQLGNAPLAIAILWSLILISSMAISDRLGVPSFAKPFLDGLLALLIDIGVDAIAIRIGYWKWAIPITEGWFGVPAGNLYSWMWVAFSYSLGTRMVRNLGTRDPGRYAYQTIVPFVAYLLLFIEIVCVGLLGTRLGLRNESQRLWIFYAHVVSFGLIVGLASLLGRKSNRGEKFPQILIWSRLSIHLYFLAALFVTGIAFKVPLLALVALLAFGLENGIKRLIA